MPQTKQGAKNRAKTPDISVLDDYYQDPSALILAQAKAALGDTKSAGMDFRYGSSRPQAAEMDRLDGWVPVVTKDENGNEKQWRHRVDPLLMRPKGESDRVKARRGMQKLLDHSCATQSQTRVTSLTH